MDETGRCWCGSAHLHAFSADYLRCSECETLVLRHFPEQNPAVVADDESALYGKHYFDRHLTSEYGYPDPQRRAREDMPERCLYWLRTLLGFKTPPGRLLELGCFHGAFVALAAHAGFEARGLDLSPEGCQRARATFGIDVLCGPIENHDIPSHSLDVIAMFDVLEHLMFPVATLQHCRKLLRKGGLLFIQTPRFPEGRSLADLETAQDPFLAQLKPKEHLYLFSSGSVRRLMEAAGFIHLKPVPAIFAHYDMSFVASPDPLHEVPVQARDEILVSSPEGRMVLALLDLDSRATCATQKREESEAWARETGSKLNTLYPQLDAVRNERNLLSAKLDDLQRNFANVEQDRALRGNVIAEQGSRLVALEAEFDLRLKELNALYPQLDALRNERNLLSAKLDDLQRQHENTDQALRLATTDRDAWRAHFDVAVSRAQVAENRHADLISENRSLLIQLSEAQRASQQAQISLAQATQDLDALRRNPWVKLSNWLRFRRTEP